MTMLRLLIGDIITTNMSPDLISCPMGEFSKTIRNMPEQQQVYFR